MLRNCSGPPSSGAHPSLPRPRLRGRPSELADGPLRAWRAFAGGWPHPAPKAPQRAILGASAGMGRPPPERGPSGSAFEVFQDVRQVCGVVAAELFEEVDFDVHWGFLSLFPLCCTSILSTSTPRVKPQRCVLHHISGHRRLPNGKTKGSSFQLPARNLPGWNLQRSNLQRSNIPPRNITQT